jgi:cytidylate kinase
VTLKAIEESTKSEGQRTKFRTARPQSFISTRGLLRLLRSTTVGVTWRQKIMHVSLDGRDVTGKIREPRVSTLVSEVSAIPSARRKMVAEQRRIARGRNIVCEGRDIGSVVFPDAELKVFLDCDIRERGIRRLKELDGAGVRAGKKAVLANLSKRDRIDSSRRISPLTRVPDAVLVDTTMLSIEEQVEVVCALARRRFGATADARRLTPSEGKPRIDTDEHR